MVGLLQQEQKGAGEHTARAVGCQAFRKVPQVPLTPTGVHVLPNWMQSICWNLHLPGGKREIDVLPVHDLFFFVPTLTIDLWARKRLPSLDVCWKNQNNVYKILQSLASKIVTYSLFCLSSQPRFTLQPWSCNLRNKWESALVPLNSGILGLHLFWIRFSVRACVNGIVSW